MTVNAHQQAMAAELGKYQLIAELARGGMGNVYLAALCGPGGFNKLLVVKQLKPELSHDETYIAMFFEEARLAARLVHPNIVQTNEVSSSEVKPFYMAMEYLDGRSLMRIVRRFAKEGGLPVGAQLRVISDALLGLHYAHELRGFDGEPLGIVHRDVSPLNLMVTFDGQAKLVDFGIAKAFDSSFETQAGVLKGRIAYMAPEQAVGAKADRRADIYSAGVMLWEAAAGRRLWQDMSDVEILTRLLRDGPPRLRDVVPGAPEELDAICARALARDCNDRYATAAELHQDLEAHIAGRHDKMTMRQIGALVGITFAEERQELNQIIHETLQRVGTLSSGVMKALRAPIAGSPSNAWPVRGESGSVSGQVVRAPQIFAPAIWNEAPSGSSGPRVTVGVEAASSGVEQALTTSRHARRRRLIGAAGLLLLILTVGMGVGSSLGRSPSGPSPTTPAWTVPAKSPASAAPTGVASTPQMPSLPTLAPTPTETATVATRADTHETAKTTPVAAPKAHAMTKPQPSAAALPPAASTTETHRPSPGNCDPPYTVDSNGIEHFKAGCL
jgi:serine/threonine protein kinase